MKIQACNLVMYPKMFAFKSNVNTNVKQNVFKDKLPNPRLYADVSDFNCPWQKREQLQQEYRSKLIDACFDKNKRLNTKLVDYLDTTKFDFETKDGTVKKMTVSEMLENIVSNKRPYKGSLYHATGTTEIGQKIIKEGFDPFKISRAKIGPGFYFTSSEGHALEYSRAVLKCDYEGTCAYVEPEFYTKLKTGNVLGGICNFVGFDTSGYPLGMDSYDAAGKILDEYVRDCFVNKMGIDMAEGYSSWNEHSIVIFNLDKISNLRFK